MCITKEKRNKYTSLEQKNVCEVYIDSSDFQRQQMYILTSVAVCFVYEKQISFELEFGLSFFRLIR